MTQTTLAQDARNLGAKRQLRDKAKQKYEELKAECDSLEVELIERMEHEEVSGIKSGGKNYVPTSTIYGTVADRDTFIKWAEEEMPELIQSQERKALVNELVRERIDSGEPLPPGVNFWAKTYISQRVG